MKDAELWPLAIAALALLVALASFVVSWAALVKDRHKVIVSGVRYEVAGGQWAVQLLVANAGRRAITMTHITVSRRPEHRGVSMSLSELSNVTRVEPGDCISFDVVPGSPLFIWDSMDEIVRCRFELSDALGRKYAVGLR